MNVIKWLDTNFERVTLMILLSLISSLLMFQIIMRYCFSSALPWAEELARYCFVTSAFLCMGYCVKENLLFRIDSLFKLLPAKLQKKVDIIMWVISLLFFLFCAIQSVKVTFFAAESRMLSTALEMPIYYLYIVATFGFSLTVLRITQHLFKIIKDENLHDEETNLKVTKKGA